MTATATVAPSATSPDRSSRIRAEALLVAGRDATGTTRVTRLRNGPPLVFRRTGPGQVHLVNVGGGPVAGDHLRLRIEVAEHADLVVRQVAASVALPAPGAFGPSRLDVEVVVGRGGRLTWWGEPIVAAAGCEHETHLVVDLTDAASLVWREEVVLGRQGESGGSVRNRVVVTRAGRTLLHTDTTAGGAAWASPAVAGGARASGSLLAAGPDANGLRDPGVPSAARLQAADDVVVVTALAPDHRGLRAMLDAAWPVTPGGHNLDVA